MKSSALHTSLLSLLLGASLFGCRGETTRDEPIVPIRNMYNQPKYSTQQKSDFFADHRNMRPPPDEVVSREEEWDESIATGRMDDGSGYVLTIPEAVVEQAGGMDALEKRGQDRYGIYCTPCHDKTGSGDGMVVRHGLVKPPTYHQDRLRHAPDEIGRAHV